MPAIALALLAESGGAAPAPAQVPTAGAPTTGAPITVTVSNVRNSNGRVHVALCPQGKFLAASCPIEVSAPAHAGQTTVVIDHVPAGDWAAQSFHDENGNREIDRALFGIPKEGVGFSRDARIVMSPPKWRDAVFHHDGAGQSISFALRYFIGPGSPEAWRKQHPTP